jgi:tRNA nucleotidyltransferase (CCA-adding enzyme)
LGVLLALHSLRLPLYGMPLAVFLATSFGLFSKESAIVAVPLIAMAAFTTAPLLHPTRSWRLVRALLALVALVLALAASIRSLRRDLDPALLLDLPPEAVALELRAMLVKCASPGRCLVELAEAGVLATISPELATQFDGRPAGPQRWHPEISQALHVVLALEWAREAAAHLDERQRLAVMFAVLCHDLGKNDTPAAEWPHHRGHESAGIPHIDQLVRRWPGFVDQQATTLARHVAALHLEIRDFAQLKSGTLAGLYDRYFRSSDYPVEAFALAVAADSAGRIGHATDGAIVREQVSRDLGLLRQACGAVDAGVLKQRFGDDLDGFRRALHEARARAIAAGRRPG